MIGKIKYSILNEKIEYRGGELRPHWNLEQTGVYGHQLVAFLGACNVKTDKLVDWEDRLANDSIAADMMLHVIGEFFGLTLQDGILLQRFFMVWAEKLLNQRGVSVYRKGDDLYCTKVPGLNPEIAYKLSVSIATSSAVSVLIHWGINFDSTGAPPTVQACGLKQYDWKECDILGFAKELLTQYIGEIEEMDIAQCKVRPVS